MNSSTIEGRSYQIDGSAEKGLDEKESQRDSAVAGDWKDEDIVYPDGGLRAWLIVAGVRPYRVSVCIPRVMG